MKQYFDHENKPFDEEFNRTLSRLVSSEIDSVENMAAGAREMNEKNKELMCDLLEKELAGSDLFNTMRSLIVFTGNAETLFRGIREVLLSTNDAVDVYGAVHSAAELNKAIISRYTKALEQYKLVYGDSVANS